MAKLNVEVQNDLDDIKLTSSKSKKEKTKKEKKTKNKKDAKSLFSKIISELKLVSWPTRKNVIKYSIATVLMLIFLSILFIGLTALFDFVYGLVQGWIN